MVTRCDFIRSRWLSHLVLNENSRFFQLLSTIKVNLVAKIMQSVYSSVIFHFKNQKVTISRGFKLMSNSW